ncbi:helix-turn-helix transcriptional regulator [Glycomyces harbinensis]|uniref:Predicted DNA-binding transcriptional regulator YafY, contains an HTH and WYL domains n=1 Tax=Glycomyces harbinensis TaxID=58114 RepID=A0A1G7DNV2_9ACTN|nr:WYL domain-containing protein [Glycomyces harbinensis]SDE53161.1 Predicted DNA-binding transcriptional regulator YafY, contains an HTH and WYL domains [Glycomyces harbinensis]
MRAGRLVSMLLLLQQRGRMTAERLSAELGVSVRTVYRDAEALGAAGIPIYGEPGHEGGYRLLEGYRTRLTGLTDAEAEVLVLAGVPEAAADLGLQAELAALELKLAAALPPGHRERAERARRVFHLDVAGWFQRADPVPLLSTVAGAAFRQQRLRVRYERWAKPKLVERDLSPLGLVLKGGKWYLVALADGAEPRTYKVANLRSAEMTEERFERPADFELADWWSRHLGDFDERRYPVRATVRFSPEAVEQAPDYLDAKVVDAIDAGQTDADGWTVAVIPIESDDHAARHLLLLGGVEVLEPVSLRGLIRSRAQEAAALHS